MSGLGQLKRMITLLSGCPPSPLLLSDFDLKISRVLVAQACNPSYSGGRDQKDRGSKPAWANSSQDPILIKPFTKKKKIYSWWSGSR
jgi:hypothetical protein